MWSWTDEAHISDEDIRELGELVDIEPADKSAKWSDTRIVFDFEEWSIFALILCEEFRFFLLSTDSHRTEFIHREDFPILPYPFTLVEGIMSIAQTDHNSNNDEKWREDTECGKRENNVKYPLGNASPWRETDTVDLDDGDLAEECNLGIKFGSLKRVRDVAIPDAIDASIFENLLEFFGREVRVHKKDFIDFLRTNKLDNLCIIANIGKSFICNFCHVGISDEIIDIRVNNLFSNIILWSLDEEEDSSFCEESSSKEGSDDTIHEYPFDNNSDCPYEEREKDNEPRQFDGIEESEREMEDGNEDEKPVESREENIENLLYLWLIDANFVESREGENKDEEKSSNESKIEEILRGNRMNREMDAGDEIGHETYVTREEKGEHDDTELDGDFDDSEQEFVTFHRQDFWIFSKRVYPDEGEGQILMFKICSFCILYILWT